MTAWADGLNFFLATHPEVRPRVMNRFEPWMVLPFSEGSIGWDIETASLRDLEAFYGGEPRASRAVRPEARPQGARRFRTGSPSRAGAHGVRAAMLLINPHTSFFLPGRRPTCGATRG